MVLPAKAAPYCAHSALNSGRNGIPGFLKSVSITANELEKALEDRYHLSAAAKGYVAGLLRHAPEITLVTNQWVNSYKRLVLGYEAPVYVSWALRNRWSVTCT